MWVVFFFKMAASGVRSKLMHISRFSMSSLTVEAPKVLSAPFSIPEKTMMGPGPTNVPERVRKAMALPTIGHLHPEFCKVIKLWIKFIVKST